jgi:hypothetical protein
MYKKPNITINQTDWPPNNGCSGPEKITNLYKGNHIDRFGSEDGFFFGIAGEPYIYRSLPWFGNYIQNNDNNNNRIKGRFYRFYSEGDKSINPDYDYHLYKVIKQFQVNSCSISPAFGYPGGGTQYRSNIKASELISLGFIKEVPWTYSPFFDEKDVHRINTGGFTKIRRRKRYIKKGKYNIQKTRRKC